MLGPEFDASDRVRIARLREELLSRADPTHRALAELSEFSSEDAARALGRDRNTFTVYEKRGKVYPAKTGKTWNIPVHHVARYFEGLWADQWDRAVTDVSPKYGQRFPLIGGKKVEDLAKQYAIDIEQLRQAIGYGYLRASVLDGQTYVFVDDFVNFVRVNKGLWCVKLVLERSDGSRVVLDERSFSRYTDISGDELQDTTLLEENGRLIPEVEIDEIEQKRKESGATKAIVVEVVFPGDNGYRSFDLT